MNDRKKYWKYWNLNTSKGRQFWTFNPPDSDRSTIKEFWQSEEGKSFLEQMSASFRFDKRKNPNSSDKVYRKCKEESGNKIREHKIPEHLATEMEKSVYHSLINGFSFYSQLQTPDGNWPGDYGGPLFLLPGLIVVAYITDSLFEEPAKSLMIQYMLNHQNDDGGWGLHIENKSTMFGTVMQYVSLRLLGKNADDEEIVKAKEWIDNNGGTTHIPPWGKFYLSLLGLYDWKGNDSLFPELWILPRWLPFHPGRYWCHARMVYLPMSYCYGYKIKAKETSLLNELKRELYDDMYSSTNWKKSRSACAVTDEYQPLSFTFKVFNFFANTYEKIHLKSIRRKALKFIIEYIDAEDRDTNYINIGPVNQVINTLCVWHHYGKDSKQFKRHVERWFDYLWLAEDGMKMNGYNGSQLWDTTFAAQALNESSLSIAFPEMTKHIIHYLDETQIKRNPTDHRRYFRTLSKGGWPFSTEAHGWPITDCTAEGMKSMIQLDKTAASINLNMERFDPERYKGAIDFLLSTQNNDGGWASYEEARAPKWIEQINPSRIFTNIMTEYSYVECSSAVMQGLKKYTLEFPDYKPNEIKKALRRGEKFLRKIQRQDGSWYGSWAVCFTYGTWFGVEGLLAAGENGYRENQVSNAIRKACEFLVSRQRTDGSWGESYLSCVKKEYVEHKTGQVVNTAWALMTLMAAQYPERKIIEKGIRYLGEMQEEDGDWPQQGISGVFNGNCMITYTAYRNVFPLWTLGRYLNNYQPQS